MVGEIVVVIEGRNALLNEFRIDQQWNFRYSEARYIEKLEL